MFTNKSLVFNSNFVTADDVNKILKKHGMFVIRNTSNYVTQPSEAEKNKFVIYIRNQNQPTHIKSKELKDTLEKTFFLTPTMQYGFMLFANEGLENVHDVFDLIKIPEWRWYVLSRYLSYLNLVFKVNLEDVGLQTICEEIREEISDRNKYDYNPTQPIRAVVDPKVNKINVYKIEQVINSLEEILENEATEEKLRERIKINLENLTKKSKEEIQLPQTQFMESMEDELPVEEAMEIPEEPEDENIEEPVDPEQFSRIEDILQQKEINTATTPKDQPDELPKEMIKTEQREFEIKPQQNKEMQNTFTSVQLQGQRKFLKNNPWQLPTIEDDDVISNEQQSPLLQANSQSFPKENKLEKRASFFGFKIENEDQNGSKRHSFNFPWKKNR